MSNDDFLQDFHWLMDVLQNIDVGLVVLDEDYNIQLWNAFMQNHSARQATDVLGSCLFEAFPELPSDWFKRKAESVRELHNTAFTTWEQRPYLFKFRNYRPVTGTTEFMYQNCSIMPLTNTRGQITHICLIIYDVTEVAANRLQLQRANSKLHIISQTDGLTGLLNRKHWEEGLEHEHKRFQRYKHTCSLMIFDIDHFKRVNDTYGHPAGDEVIRQTAQLLKDTVRDIDICGRYGGEEFTVILVDTNAEGSLVVAERLRKVIEDSPVYYDEHVINYTVSIGIAEITENVVTPTSWIEAADRGLYRAKRAGRNQVQITKDEQ